MTNNKPARTTRATCTGTTALDIAAEGMYGRLICATCGNSVLPNTDGLLRRHVAKRTDERTRIACKIVFTAEQEAVFAANQG
jgi:hypothetical protein